MDVPRSFSHLSACRHLGLGFCSESPRAHGFSCYRRCGCRAHPSSEMAKAWWTHAQLVRWCAVPSIGTPQVCTPTSELGSAHFPHPWQVLARTLKLLESEMWPPALQGVFDLYFCCEWCNQLHVYSGCVYVFWVNFVFMSWLIFLLGLWSAPHLSF